MLTNPDGSISIRRRCERTEKDSRSFSLFDSLVSKELQEDVVQYQRAATLIFSLVHSNSLRSGQNLRVNKHLKCCCSDKLHVAHVSRGSKSQTPNHFGFLSVSSLTCEQPVWATGWTKLSTFLKQNEFNHILGWHIDRPSQTGESLLQDYVFIHALRYTPLLHRHITHRETWLDWLREYEYVWV